VELARGVDLLVCESTFLSSAGEEGLAADYGHMTARQAGTALGVAIYGAIAGSPAHPAHFIDALLGLGIAAAILWIALAGLTTATART
jgi:DHA2 family methylenomycin A resistance protein-like MFS transporter